ncbi:MAG TPA: RNA polymerase factor sigma-54 [Nitrospiria bacterium]|nr:RNA polymerase factor sigma-54 [Nitrospiria bacterium]HUK57528.1 RNA polymerase factor sigma-54 [Nitrospiria bacterium]
MMKTRLDLRLTQKLIMTPQLQQAIKLLQLSRLELTQIVSQELLENPLLDELTDLEETVEEKKSEEDERTEETATDAAETELSSQWEEYIGDIQRENKETEYPSAAGDEPPSYEQTLTRPPSLSEHLLWQLRLSVATPRAVEIGKSIIGNIDEDGYLRISVEELATLTEAKKDEVERALTLVQSFDPLGVGARDLRECLLIQLEQLGLKGSLAEAIVANHLKEIETRRFQDIVKALGVSLEEVLAVVKIIQALEPKPGRPFLTDEAQIIIPDIFVVKSDDGYVVVLNDDGLPKLRISPYYQKLLLEKKQVPDATRNYLEGRFRSAIWLVRSIEQRNRTICKVAQSIVKFQREFLEKGVDYLKPLVLRQVADDISMHESTISRVTTNKYMHTPQGIFELKYFFNSSLSRSGEFGGEVSSVTVREIIRQMVSQEDPKNPLKDQEIVQRLKNQHIEIARRTVAKYRVELKIPQASRRRYVS